jgi:hypothetical protein
MVETYQSEVYEMVYEGKKNTDKWFPLSLVDSVNLNTAETGIVFGSVTCKYGYEGATSQSGYAVTTNDWKEQGAGDYWLNIGASEFTSEGKYRVRVSATGCYDVVMDILVKDNTEAEMQDTIDLIPNTTEFEARTLLSADYVVTTDTIVGVTTAGSVTNDVGITQIGADKVWGTTARALTDKTGFSLSTAGIKAIWDQLTSALTVVGSIGNKLTDWVLGMDNKVLLSTDTQSGVTIPTVTSVTNAVTTTSDTQIDNIEADTNELQGLISSSKIAAQVKGIEADVITASSLNTDAVTEIVAGIKARIIDGTITGEKLDKIMLAIFTGKIEIISGVYYYYDKDANLILTDPILPSGSTRVIS